MALELPSTSKKSPLAVALLSVSIAVWTFFLLPNLPRTVAENAHVNFGPYLEVYPSTAGHVYSSQEQLSCVPSENRRCPLYIALTVSFGGDYISSGVIASIQYALDQINEDSSLLPGYSLHYTLTDSQVDPSVCRSTMYHISKRIRQLGFLSP